MFVKINDKYDLLYQLSKAREDFVIHYRCFNCGDEQVTYEHNTFDADRLIGEIETQGYITLGHSCTNCGRITRILSPNCIQGLETL